MAKDGWKGVQISVWVDNVSFRGMWWGETEPLPWVTECLAPPLTVSLDYLVSNCTTFFSILVYWVNVNYFIRKHTTYFYSVQSSGLKWGEVRVHVPWMPF